MTDPGEPLWPLSADGRSEVHHVGPDGRFELSQRLDGGGQADIWLGWDQQTGRQVAVKTPKRSDGRGADQLAARRLIREAKILHALGGPPHVMPLLGWSTGSLRRDEDDPEETYGSLDPWMAMPYLRHRTLEKLLGESGPVGADEWHDIAYGHATGLAALHAHRVIHRDLSFRNVLLTGDGPVLADLGLAWATSVTDGEDVEYALSSTQQLRAEGTRDWYAPELMNEDLAAHPDRNPAYDVYNWGLYLATAAAGRHPWSHIRRSVTLTKGEWERMVPRLQPPLDRRRLVPGDRRRNALVLAALSPRPGDRPTARELISELERGGGPAPLGDPWTGVADEPVAAGRSRTARALIVALVLVVLAGGAGLWQWLRSRPPTAYTLTATELVSSDAGNAAANADSGRPALDDDGRYVAFTSAATNLDGKDTGGLYHIYRKDRKTREILRASVAADGSPADGQSQFPMICATGRYLAFASVAGNLLSDRRLRRDDAVWRVYVKDTVDGSVELVSTGADGRDPLGDSRDPHFSADCGRVVFESDASGLTGTGTGGANNIYVRDRARGTTTLVSRGPGGAALDNASGYAEISPDGNLVAFTSWASNLTGASPRARPGIFVRNLTTGATTAVSAAMHDPSPDIQGYSWPQFSPDGRYLVFRSITDPLDPTQRGKHVYVWDLKDNRSALTNSDGSPTGWNDGCVDGTSNGTKFAPQISGPGRDHSYRVLYTTMQGLTCRPVLRDLDGSSVPIRPQPAAQEILEPAMNASGDVLAWAVAGRPQLIYACDVARCDK
jgi:Tol biopolymer transport system component